MPAPQQLGRDAARQPLPGAGMRRRAPGERRRRVRPEIAPHIEAIRLGMARRVAVGARQQQEHAVAGLQRMAAQRQRLGGEAARVLDRRIVPRHLGEQRITGRLVAVEQRVPQGRLALQRHQRLPDQRRGGLAGLREQADAVGVAVEALQQPLGRRLGGIALRWRGARRPAGHQRAQVAHQRIAVAAQKNRIGMTAARELHLKRLRVDQSVHRGRESCIRKILADQRLVQCIGAVQALRHASCRVAHARCRQHGQGRYRARLGVGVHRAVVHAHQATEHLPRGGALEGHRHRLGRRSHA